MEIKPDTLKYKGLISRIEDGRMKIPAFQRNFVWPMSDTLKLLDSICRGYPIGTFLVWKTKNYLRSMRNIGNLQLKEPPSGDFIQYILDGQQRVTSIYAAVNAADIDGREYRIVADLDSSNESERIFSQESPDNKRFVLLSNILGEDHLSVHRNLSESRANRFSKIREVFITHPFSTIEIDGGDLDVVCDIFERVNTRGKKLSLFDLLVARTWISPIENEPGFDLRDEFDNLRKEVEQRGFGEISEPVLAYLAGAKIKQACTRKAVLSIEREELRNEWKSICSALKEAIDSLRAYVPTFRLLPYPAMLAPIAYFHARNNGGGNGRQTQWLSRYFYLNGFSGHLSATTETNLTDDLKKIEELAEGEFPELDMRVQINPEYIRNITLRPNAADCRSVLCLLAEQNPRRLKTGDKILLRGENLKRANSQHYHHIFPKAYMRGKKGEEFVNSIANIMFVPANENLQISKKPPSEYLPLFENGNMRMQWDETLKSHLLDGDVYDALIEDDFPRFIEARAKRLSELAQEMTAQA